MLSGLFAASNVPLSEQSALPKYRGLPWWGAILCAVVLTGIGAAVDAKLHGSLGLFYQVLYLVGCVGAALAVRRRALFTAAVQPPLVAFAVSIVALYAINADVQMSVKTLIFKLALPIASSFPSMAVTFVLTLAVVVARWYITRDSSTNSATASSQTRKPAQKQAATSTAKARPQRTKKPATSAQPSKSAQARPATPAKTERGSVAVVDDERRPAPRRAAQPRQQQQQRPAARPRPQQQPAPTRRTAGAAARAAGLDLTAEYADDPAPRRRPPAPPAR